MYINFNVTGGSISLTRRCDKTSDCDDHSDELLCSPTLYNNVIEATPKNFPDDSIMLFSCAPGNTTVRYSVDDLCVHDTSKAVQCQHDEHLFHCRDYHCPSMFKVSISHTYSQRARNATIVRFNLLVTIIPNVFLKVTGIKHLLNC